MPADRLVKMPDGISDRTAATLMLKGLTVQYLFRQTYRARRRARRSCSTRRPAASG